MAEKVIGFRIEFDGVKVAIANQKELRDEIVATRKEIKQTDDPKAYDQLQKRLAVLQKLQQENRKENRNFANQLVADGKTAAGAYDRLNAELAVLRKGIKDIQASGGVVPKGDVARLKQLDKQLKDIDKSVGQSFRNVGNYREALTSVGDIITGGLISGGIEAFVQTTIEGVRQSIDLFNEQEKAITKVGQAIAQTGGAAGFSLQELTDEAGRLQEGTIFGDEEILNGVTAQLLTFTNIAGDNFLRTQEAALNLATVLDGDLQSSSIQLGKALNDPAKNLSALSRSGIQFSKEQVEVVKQLQETNRLAEAQEIILNELNKQYGGQAAAQAQTYSGALQQVRNTFGDLQETVGGFIVQGLNALVPVFQGAIGLLRTGFNFLVNVTAPVREAFGRLFEALNEVNIGGQSLGDLFSGYLSGAITFASRVFSGLVNGVATLVEGFNNARESSTLFGRVISGVGNLITGFLSTVSQIPSFFNGLFEVVLSFGDAVSNSFQRSKLSAQIFVEDLKAIFSDAASVEADRLRNQRNDIEGAGKTLRNAFQKGFNASSNVSREDVSLINTDESRFRQIGKTNGDAFTDGLSESLSSNNVRLASDSIAALRNQVSELKKELENAPPDQLQESLQKLASAESDLNAAQDALDKLKESLREPTPEQELEVSISRVQTETQRQVLDAGVESETLEEFAERRKEIEQKADEEILRLRLESGTLSEAQTSEALTKLQELRLRSEEETQRELNEIRNQAIESAQSSSEENRNEADLNEALRAVEVEKNARLAAAAEQATTLEQLADLRKQIEQETEIEILQLKLDSGILEIDQEAAIQARIKEIRLESEDETNQEVLARREELTEQIANLAGQAASKIFEIQKSRIDREEESDIDAVNRRYDAEIEAAEGNEERQQALRDEREAQITKIEKEAAQRRKDIALKEAAIEIALQLIRALGNPFQAALIAALAPIQLAAIESQEFKRGGEIEIPTLGQILANGGVVRGPSHAQGGVKYRVGQRNVELEGGEGVINKSSMQTDGVFRATGTLRQIASAINSYKNNGVKFASNAELQRIATGSNFQDGGIIPGASFAVPQGITDSLAREQVTVVNVQTTLSDADVERIAEAVRQGAQTGAESGSETGAMKAKEREIAENRRTLRSTRR